MFERSEWDAEEGLFVARLQLQVEAVDPIEACTQVVRLGTLEHEAAPVVPIGIERVAVGDTLEVEVQGRARAGRRDHGDQRRHRNRHRDGRGLGGDGGRQGARHRDVLIVETLSGGARVASALRCW